MNKLKTIWTLLRNKDAAYEYSRYIAIREQQLEELIDETEMWIDENVDLFFITKESLEDK